MDSLTHFHSKKKYIFIYITVVVLKLLHYFSKISGFDTNIKGAKWVVRSSTLEIDKL